MVSERQRAALYQREALERYEKVNTPSSLTAVARAGYVIASFKHPFGYARPALAVVLYRQRPYTKVCGR